MAEKNLPKSINFSEDQIKILIGEITTVIDKPEVAKHKGETGISRDDVVDIQGLLDKADFLDADGADTATVAAVLRYLDVMTAKPRKPKAKPQPSVETSGIDYKAKFETLKADIEKLSESAQKELAAISTERITAEVESKYEEMKQKEIAEKLKAQGL